jgi:hypothetical protein
VTRSTSHHAYFCFEGFFTGMFVGSLFSGDGSGLVS